MTTIAYRAGVLASDTLVTIGETRSGTTVKIGRTADGFLWGVCGTMQALQAYRGWVEARAGDPPKFDEATLILVSPKGDVSDWYGAGWCESHAEFQAWGSGDQIAIGAMGAGASAKQAVKVAIRFNTSSGGDVTVMKL